MQPSDRFVRVRRAEKDGIQFPHLNWMEGETQQPPLHFLGKLTTVQLPMHSERLNIRSLNSIELIHFEGIT